MLNYQRVNKTSKAISHLFYPPSTGRLEGGAAQHVDDRGAEVAQGRLDGPRWCPQGWTID